mmetsp:Transcript_4707/g.6468  ORF Transcript_4707/g.6468 Transcript_4707/m.6468 type:complete len:210 (-) Transcript_4707:138-767(-)
MDESCLRNSVKPSIEQGEYSQALMILEELELMDAEKEDLVPNIELQLSLQMLLYLIQDDLANARYLWKRTPPALRQADSPFAHLWTIGTALWKRDIVTAYIALNQQWPEDIATLIPVLRERIQNRQLNLIEKAYQKVSIACVAEALGESEDTAVSVCTTRGWAVDKESNQLLPVCQRPKMEANDPKTGSEHLKQLTEYIMFLEQKNSAS